MKIKALFAICLVAAASFVVATPAAFAQSRGDDRVGPGFSNNRPDGPNRRDWLRTASQTPEGGFRIGNPDARFKLVEYISLTCDHCAEFAHQAGERLFQQYVRTGRVSVEYRNYYLNGADIAAALLTRCATPNAYFDITHNLLGTQPAWMGRIQSVTPAQRQELAGLPPLQVAQRIVALLGLDVIGQRHGITAAQRQQCLTQPNLDRLQQMHQAAEQAGVTGTPTFFINGTKVEANSWAAIEPLLRAQ